MNKFNVAGILQSYSEKCRNCRDKEHLIKLIRELKYEVFSSQEMKKITEAEED